MLLGKADQPADTYSVISIPCLAKAETPKVDTSKPKPAAAPAVEQPDPTEPDATDTN